MKQRIIYMEKREGCLVHAQTHTDVSTLGHEGVWFLRSVINAGLGCYQLLETRILRIILRYYTAIRQAGDFQLRRGNGALALP